MKKVVLLLAVTFAIGFAACEKKNHKILASKVDPTIWTIDEMSYLETHDSTGATIVHDTLLAQVGRFEFLHEKNRFKHGTGQVYRREYVNGGWSNESQQAFTWSVNEDELTIIYQDGTRENVEILESKRKSQHWISTAIVNGATFERTYFLSKNFE